MPKSDRTFPKYSLHKPSGQARVRIDGKDHYLGEYGSPASKAMYEDLKQQWHINRGDVSAWSCTIDDLAIRFIEHAKEYYVKHGEPTSEVNNMRVALRPLVKLFGPLRVANFQTKHIKQYRDKLINAGIARTSINRQLTRIKHVFRWGKEEGLVTAAALAEVLVSRGLREGRSRAVESEPVKPVASSAVKAVEPFVSRQVWGMIRLQTATGMRPGEIVRMRGCELNMSGKTWEYTPSRHKTEHLGKERVIFIGPRGQDVIREFLKPDLMAFLFSPIDARAEFDARRKANRKSPMESIGGTFKLRYKTDDPTSDLPFNETADNVQAALEASASIGTGNVSVTGGPFSYTVEFIEDLANAAAGPLAIDGTNLTGPYLGFSCNQLQSGHN